MAPKTFDSHVELRFPYLARDPLYQKERPYVTDFAITDSANGKASNHVFEFTNLVVHDAQAVRSQFSLRENGFCFLREPTTLTTTNAHDVNYIEEQYYTEIEDVLHRNFPAYARLECLDHQVRIRSDSFPNEPGKEVKYAQPAALPHSDFSYRGGSLAMQHFFPGQEKFYEGRDFDLLNVWRVLKGPNNAWPLAVCDSKTIDREHDVCANDVLHEWWVGENQLLHKNDQHAWYYLSNQDVDDLIVFRNMDSKDRRASGFHAAFDTGVVGTPARQSIEVRVVAFR